MQEDNDNIETEDELLLDDENPYYEAKIDEKLDEDYETPFSPPDDMPEGLPLDHPATDSGIDSQELYDEGLDAAAENY